MIMTVLIILSNAAVSLWRGVGFTDIGEIAADAGIIFCIGQILMSVNLPLVLKLGAEKGRLLYIFITLAVMMLILNFKNIMPVPIKLSYEMCLAAAVVTAAVALCLSMETANKIYGKKRR